MWIVQSIRFVSAILLGVLVLPYYDWHGFVLFILALIVFNFTTLLAGADRAIKSLAKAAELLEKK